MGTDGGVSAYCPTCKAVANFEPVAERTGKDAIYKFTRCARCGRGGMARCVTSNGLNSLELQEFNPQTIDHASIPIDVPDEIRADFQEAELCMSVGALRAACIMFRAVLERVFQDCGYSDEKFRTLTLKIGAAAVDKLIAETRIQRAKTIIKTLGDEAVHREWREFKREEVDLSRQYCQRILEDLYDDRDIVEKSLLVLNRINQADIDGRRGKTIRTAIKREL